MAQPNLAVQPLWREFRHLPQEERMAIFDDAMKNRQLLEAMDEYPVLETLDEYQIRVWKELAL